MATYSNILSWKISWTEEPDGLQSMGLKKVGDGRVTKFLSVPVLSSLLFCVIIFIESFDLWSYSVNHVKSHKVYLTVWTGSQGTDYRVRKKSEKSQWFPRSLQNFSFTFKLNVDNNPYTQWSRCPLVKIFRHKLCGSFRLWLSNDESHT